MNDTTFQGNGKITYVPVVVNAKQQKPPTNADRVRSMTDEELARYLHVITCEDGYPAHDTIPEWLDWLQQEAE